MRFFVLVSLIVFGAINGAMAAVGSAEYIKEQAETKVDVSESANQTMAGTYKVTGRIEVPTPDLPSD